MDKIKEFIQKLDSKVKKLILMGTGGVIVFAVIVAVLLNNRPYEVMFSDVNEEEAQQIIGKLQESNVNYQYKAGDILVQKDVLEKTKANLVYEGYPKSGFTYDVFKENTGLMTTDSDKKTYKIYELQNRIGATISLFEGVKDAKITIALGEEDKYALGDSSKEQEASATATVIMRDNGSPTSEQAKAIQRLVSRSIPGMTFQNVSVFDGNGIEVTPEEKVDATTSGRTNAELVEVIESQIERNVLNVLTPIYGNGNVRVSPKAKLNMEELIRESIQYSTPEKIDANDKNGIISKEEKSEESQSSEDAQGVAGSETNSDVPEYNVGDEKSQEGYNNNSEYREYLVNQIKEQGQISPGMLEDLTVSVAINGEDFGKLTDKQVRELIGNASGMEVEDQERKITVVSAPFFKAQGDKILNNQELKLTIKEYFIPIIIGVVCLIILAVIIIIRKRKRRKRGDESVDTANLTPVAKLELSEGMINLQNEKGVELKRNIRDFAEQNPEISAQLLKSWLNGGDQNE